MGQGLIHLVHQSKVAESEADKKRVVELTDNVNNGGDPSVYEEKDLTTEKTQEASGDDGLSGRGSMVTSAQSDHEEKLSQKEKDVQPQVMPTYQPHIDTGQDGTNLGRRKGTLKASTNLISPLSCIGLVLFFLSSPTTAQAAADVPVLTCNTTLDYIGATKGCGCYTSSDGVTGMRFILNGRDVVPDIYHPKRDFTNSSRAFLSLPITSGLDKQELHCAASLGAVQSVPSNSITIMIARVKLSVRAEMSGGMLHLNVTVDGPVPPATSYHATITPGNISINITSFISNYLVDVNFSRCALYQIVVYARSYDIPWEMTSPEVPIFTHDLTIRDIRVRALADPDWTTVQIFLEQMVCLPFTRVQVDGMLLENFILSDNVISFRHKSRQRHVSVTVNGRHWKSISTYDIQKTIVNHHWNGLRIRSEFIDESRALGVMYVIVPVVEYNSVISGAIFRFVPKSKAESERGVTLDLHGGIYWVYSFVWRESGVDKNATYKNEEDIPGNSEGEVHQPEGSQCDLERTNNLMVFSIKCRCPSTNVLQLLIAKNVRRAQFDVMIEKQLMFNCSQSVQFEVRDVLHRQVMVHFQGSIIFQSDLTAKSGHDSRHDSDYVAVAGIVIGVLLLLSVLVVGSVVGVVLCAIYKCRCNKKKAHTKLNTSPGGQCCMK